MSEQGNGLFDRPISRRELLKNTGRGLIGVAAVKAGFGEGSVSMAASSSVEAGGATQQGEAQPTVDELVQQLARIQAEINELSVGTSSEQGDRVIALAKQRRSAFFALMESDVSRAREMMTTSDTTREKLAELLQGQPQESIDAVMEKRIQNWEGGWGVGISENVQSEKEHYNFGRRVVSEDGQESYETFVLNTDQSVARIAPPVGNHGGDIVIRDGWVLRNAILADENAISAAPQVK